MNKLSSKQIRAAQLEATGMKAKEIAQELGVTPQTISAYRKLDEYQVLVSKNAQATYRAAQLKLIHTSLRAVDVFDFLILGAENNVKLQAAKAVLDYIGMGDVKNKIGATSIAELKAGEVMFGDLDYLKDVHRELDEYLSEVSEL